jgi:hypothetical protein
MAQRRTGCAPPRLHELIETSLLEDTPIERARMLLLHPRRAHQRVIRV